MNDESWRMVAIHVWVQRTGLEDSIILSPMRVVIIIFGSTALYNEAVLL